MYEVLFSQTNYEIILEFLTHKNACKIFPNDSFRVFVIHILKIHEFAFFTQQHKIILPNT